MKIIIRATCGRDVDEALGSELSLPPGSPLPDFDANSEVFDRLLAVSKTRSRCWFNPWMEFSRSELEQCRFFQLECRGRVLKEKKGDYELNVGRLRTLPFLENGPGAKIRLLDRIALRGVSVKPNEIAGASEWMAEFIVAREVGRLFEKEGLTGFSLKHVFNQNAQSDYDDLFQLFSDKLMPRAIVDITTPVHPDSADRDHRRQLACLSYDFGDKPPSVDFCRTAEAWSSNDMPVWIVSARVRECFAHYKLRGWSFRPVLDLGTELHTNYMRMWASLFARVGASHPGHFF